MERVLAAQPGVRAACVVGLPDAEWGAGRRRRRRVGAATTAATQVLQRSRAGRARPGRGAAPLVAVAELPLRGIGKPDRAAVARLVSAAAERRSPGSVSPPRPRSGGITVRALTPADPIRCAAPHSSQTPHPGGSNMRTLLPLLAAVVLLATAGPARGRGRERRPGAPPLSSGSGAGVAVQGGAARIDQRTAFRAPREDGAAEGTPGHGRRRPACSPSTRTGSTSPTNRVAATVAARLTEGATAAVDVRGLRANGNWSEWIPADDGAAVLPEPVRRRPGPPRAHRRPRPGGHRARRCTALASVQRRRRRAPRATRCSYQVFATREGLVGGTTANGHVIAPHDRFVALPVPPGAVAATAAATTPSRICAPNGRCAFAPVWDVGPWNTKRRLLERRAASSGATSRRARRRPRPRSATATTAARTGSAARWPTRRASTSPTAPSGTTSG